MKSSSYTVEYLPLAQKDLIEIATYIADVISDTKIAYEFVENMIREFDFLSTFPYKNQTFIPIKPLKYEYRVIPFKNYHAYYFVNEEMKIVTIVRVLHQKRNAIDSIE